MKRKHKIYSRPKRPFDKQRILEEGEIKEEFGLKNKKEIWRAEARIKDLRSKAKNLISKNDQDQNKFFERVKKTGFQVKSIGDVLALDKKDYLKRRLQTIVFNKNLAPTVKSARQLITHKKIKVNNKIITSPSYLVKTEEENKITKI